MFTTVVIAVAGGREVFHGGVNPSGGRKDYQIFFAGSTFVRIVSRRSRDFA
jgi:hypothetical protein